MFSVNHAGTASRVADSRHRRDVDILVQFHRHGAEDQRHDTSTVTYQVSYAGDAAGSYHSRRARLGGHATSSTARNGETATAVGVIPTKAMTSR
jgi:hypothetical protein